MSFTIGSLACFVVVIVTSLLITILANTPVVFLRLSETTGSEVDITVLPDSSNRLNYTEFSTILSHSQNSDFYSYHSPRVVGGAYLFNPIYCNDEYSFDLEKDILTCNNGGRRGYLYVNDFAKEKKIGIGRQWNYDFPGQGEIYISSRLSKDIKVVENEQLIIQFDLSSFIHQIYDIVHVNDSSSHLWKNFNLPLKVKGVFSDPLGKSSNRYSRIMFMDFNSFLPYLLIHLSPYLPQQEIDLFKQIKLEEFVDQIVVELPPSVRNEYYISNNYDTIQNNLLAYSSDILYKVGFNVAYSTLPVLRYLRIYNVINLFLGLIINIIILILLFISTLLIYSLLITNVETRTFEIGIFRMLGMNRTEVISLLLFQAISYITISFPIGILIAQLIAVYLSKEFTKIVNIEISPQLTWNAILLSAFIGTIMPLVASIFPIKSALSYNLHDSIDTRQSKTKAISISVSRTEDNFINWNWIIVGLSTSLFGFTVYYVLPLSLLTFDLSLLLYIFVLLLLCLLVGSTMLSLNLQNSLERLLTNLLFFWDNKAIRAIVLKNFVAHKIRNRKTTILYAVSLAFIVFISVSYEIQLRTFLYKQQQANGCLMKVTASGASPFTESRNSIESVRELEEFAMNNKFIESFGWISHPLNSFDHFVSLKTTNIGHVASGKVDLYAVSPNLFSATLDGFLSIGDFNKNKNTLGLLPSLYTIDGSHQLILGQAFKNLISVNIEEQLLLTIKMSNTYIPPPDTASRTERQIDAILNIQDDFTGPSYTFYHRMEPLAFLEAAPAFIFSPFPAILVQDCLVSFTTYMRLSDGVVESVSDIPLRDFIIKFKEGISNDDLDIIKEKLESIIESDYGVSVWDYRDEVSTINQASQILAYFFDFTTIVAMIVCYFSLNR